MSDPLLTLDRPEPQEVAALPPTDLPARGAVFREQLETVGLSLRRETLAFGILLAVFTVLIGWQIPRVGDVDVTPEGLIPLAMLGVLTPLLVWKTEAPGRRGYHRAMPVDEAEHALGKVAAGWLWTMAAGAGYLAWLLALAFTTGGSVSAEAPFMWLAPFVGTTVLYLLVSAVALVAKHPWRWVAGALAGYVLVEGLSEGIVALEPVADLLRMLWIGDYGLLTVLIGQTRGLVGHFLQWVPDVGSWLVASAGWLTASLTAVLVAARRQPDE